MNNIVEATKKVIGKILISKAFNPSISAGFGPLGAYKMNKKELITEILVTILLEVQEIK